MPFQQKHSFSIMCDSCSTHKTIFSLQIINTYTEAVQTVDPMKATGKPHSLWVSFAKFYEENEQLDDVS